jgi:hypothetical protein
VTERILKNDFTPGEDAKGATGKSVVGDCLVQDAVSGSKPATRKSAGWSGRDGFGLHRLVES